MISLKKAVEDSIIVDLNKDATLACIPPRPHDYPKAKAGDDSPLEPEQKATLTVTADDQGEAHFGTGVHKIRVTVEIRANGAADNFSGTLLDDLDSRVNLRLQVSAPILDANNNPVGRENSFSNAGLKVFGIQADPGARTNSGLERIRTCSRIFVACQPTSGTQFVVGPTTQVGFVTKFSDLQTRQTFSNANVTVSAGTTTLAQTGAMSASLSITLPLASSYINGTGFALIDESGTLDNNHRFNVIRAGSDTINGGTSAIMVIEPLAYFQSDGISKWTVNTDGNRFVDSLGRAHFLSLSLGSSPGTIEVQGVFDFFGVAGDGITFDFTGGNNDDDHFYVKGVNGFPSFLVNGRGQIEIVDDSDPDGDAHKITISPPVVTDRRTLTWPDHDGTLTAQVSPPASAGSSGAIGQWAFDTGFIYVCTATNTWKRVAIATW